MLRCAALFALAGCGGAFRVQVDDAPVVRRSYPEATALVAVNASSELQLVIQESAKVFRGCNLGTAIGVAIGGWVDGIVNSLPINVPVGSVEEKCKAVCDNQARYDKLVKDLATAQSELSFWEEELRRGEENIRSREARGGWPWGCQSGHWWKQSGINRFCSDPQTKRRFHGPSMTYEECQSRCNTEPDCQAFMGSIAPSKRGACWTFPGTCSETSHSNSYRVYHKETEPMTWTKSTVRRTCRDSDTNPQRSYKGSKTEAQCKALCAQDSECTAIFGSPGSTPGPCWTFRGKCTQTAHQHNYYTWHKKSCDQLDTVRDLKFPTINNLVTRRTEKASELMREVARLQGEVDALSWMEAASQQCDMGKVLFNSLVKVLNEMRCQLITLFLKGAAYGLDKFVVGPALAPLGGAVIIAMQNSPMCAKSPFQKGQTMMATIKTSLKTAVQTTSGGSMIIEVVKFLLCQTLVWMAGDKDLGPFAKRYLSPFAPGFDWTNPDHHCSNVEFFQDILEFGFNIACGKLVGAFLAIMQPLLMCRIPKKDGSPEMCQERGCHLSDMIDSVALWAVG